MPYCKFCHNNFNVYIIGENIYINVCNDCRDYVDKKCEKCSILFHCNLIRRKLYLPEINEYKYSYFCFGCDKNYLEKVEDIVSKKTIHIYKYDMSEFIKRYNLNIVNFYD